MSFLVDFLSLEDSRLYNSSLANNGKISSYYVDSNKKKTIASKFNHPFKLYDVHSIPSL